MALDRNRRYNTIRGLPVAAAQLTTGVRGRGYITGYGDTNVPCFIETTPKTGSGLPTGDDAEEYIVDFGPGVYSDQGVFANGTAIDAGTDLTHVISTVASTYSGNAEVGDLTNASTAITGLTFVALAARVPVLHKLTTGTSLAAAAHSTAEVILF